MTEPDKIVVTCAGCGTKYDMPNIGVVPIMNNCPDCVKKPKRKDRNLRGGMVVGPKRDYTGHYEQDIACSFGIIAMDLPDGLVTLVVQRNGLVVCRSWKKCKFHGVENIPVEGKGVTACPETQWRNLVGRRLRMKRDVLSLARRR